MRRTLAVALPLAVVLALAIWRARGPEAKPETAPATTFSSARSLKTLRGLLVEGVPHPMATPANKRVQARAITQFRVLGYESEVQRRFACNAAAVCGMVENVIARQPGAARRDVVLLMAHYDSVGAGIGASDDGVGTAALLEIARAMKGERFRNPVAFLLTDGEEAGLLGAEGFVADETLAAEVGAVVNVEMRGTQGPSNMFETSTGNRWLIRHLSRALQRPQATSFFYAIYNLLPNDTDVTILKRAGKPAVNFAAIRGVHWYHTRLDDLAHVNARTLQHHGDNLLATTRVLANADLAARSRTDATYFDVLNFFLVWWPQEWTLWMAVASLILLIVAVRRMPPREMTFGVLTAFATILAALGAGLGVAWLTSVRHSSYGFVSFVARPAAAIAAMWLTGFAAALFAATLFRTRAKPLPMLYGIAIVWHMIGIAVAVTLPGAAFLFVVPAMFVTICALARAEETATSAVAATAGAIFIFPMALILYDALGSRLMVAIAILIGTLATFVAPLLARAVHALAALVAAIVLAIVAMMQPAYDAEHPQTISISYVDDVAAATPLWVVPEWTASLAKAATFHVARRTLTPWNRGSGWSAPAPRVNLPRVSVSGKRDGERLTVSVRSSRGANRMTLLLNGNVRVLTVNGVPPPPRPARFRERLPAGWHFAVANGVQEMIVECTGRGPVQAVASDMTFGLPPGGEPIARARDAAPAIPIHDGDLTITRARTRF